MRKTATSNDLILRNSSEPRRRTRQSRLRIVHAGLSPTRSDAATLMSLGYQAKSGLSGGRRDGTPIQPPTNSTHPVNKFARRPLTKPEHTRLRTHARGAPSYCCHAER
jgi:hypothetical protein